MASDNEILGLIRKRVGLAMTQSSDFDTLSQSIKDATNEHLGINTLKRLFGFKTDKVVPRLSTMDIVARYLGHEDYDALLHAIGDNADISLFAPIDCLDVRELEKGSQVRISYEPGRIIVITYLGDSQFIINEIAGSRNLMKGDVLTITQLAVGHRLVVANVVRDGHDLGAYESAKYKGLKSVEII